MNETTIEISCRRFAGMAEAILALSHSDIALQAAKCFVDYPEYQTRLKSSELQAFKEARQGNYTVKQTDGFVKHRIGLELEHVHADMLSAFQIATAKLKFSRHKDFLFSPAYLSLMCQVKTLPEFEVTYVKRK